MPRPRLTDRSRYVRHDQVVCAVREQIVRGKLKPGDRLPDRERLEGRFNTSYATVQKALANLKRDGFITTRGRLGTYVVDRPPHLIRHGLVFEHRPDDRIHWTRLASALSVAAGEVASALDIEFPAYHNINDHLDAEDLRVLTTEVQLQRLAGLIFVDPPYFLGQTDSPVFYGAGLPRVCWGRPWFGHMCRWSDWIGRVFSVGHWMNSKLQAVAILV